MKFLHYKNQKTSNKKENVACLVNHSNFRDGISLWVSEDTYLRQFKFYQYNSWSEKKEIQKSKINVIQPSSLQYAEINKNDWNILVKFCHS